MTCVPTSPTSMNETIHPVSRVEKEGELESGERLKLCVRQSGVYKC